MMTQDETTERYDHRGNLIASKTEVVDITAEVVTLDIHAKARAAVEANQAFLASTPTSAEAAAQVKALTRQVNGVIRLLLGGDLLLESD